MGDHTRPKKTRKQNNKVRVKLPGIESYEKELEFTAEGPGRVVVRLERLMGSDRIRITDPKYLATLVERLESEETHSWVSRSRLRKKAEKNRSRQLAIDGLMEPTEDMQDLYNHPVFRVNRVLNRLNLFDYNMSHTGTGGKLPPIHPVEPFCEDDTGSIFKKYAGHTVVFVEDLPDYESHHSISNADLTLGRTKTDIIMQAKEEAKKASGSTKSKPTVASGSEDENDDKDEEEQEEEGGSEEGDEEEMDERNINDLPDQLIDLQKYYGVPSEEDLIRNWQPYRSDLVDAVFDEQEDHKELYSIGEDVESVYARQHETVKEYVVPLEQEAMEFVAAHNAKAETMPAVKPEAEQSKSKQAVQSTPVQVKSQRNAEDIEELEEVNEEETDAVSENQAASEEGTEGGEE